MQLTASHPSGTYNFEGVSRYFENLLTPVLLYVYKELELKADHHCLILYL